MKKIFAILTVLAMAFTMTAAALAEEPAAPVLISNVQFGMDMEQVMQSLNLPNPEIDHEKTRGPVEFYELEYEKVAGADGFTADIKFLFAGNELVAIHYDMADGTSYETVREQLTAAFGEAVPFNAADIGNARYAIDDDGDLEDCREMILANGVTVILERDHDGDVNICFLDPTAAYINP